MVHQQTDRENGLPAADASVLDARATALLRIPSDPLAVNKHPRARTAHDVFEEKQRNWDSVRAFAAEFSPAGTQLVEAIGQLSFRLHCDQFRLSPDFRKHASDHLVGVAARAVQSPLPNVAPLFSIDGQPIAAAAFAYAAGLAHDTFEDVGETIGKELPDTERMKLVEELMRSALAPILEAGSIDRFVDTVKHLTIQNEIDFPDNTYVAGILSDPVALAVKRADIRHNLETYHLVAPEHGAIIALAQYGKFVLSTPWSDQYIAGFGRCLACMDPSSEKTQQLIDRLIEQCGETKLVELQNLLFAVSNRYPDAVANASRLDAILEQQRGFSLPTAKFPVTQREFDGIRARTLGPVTAWGGELQVPGLSLQGLKSLIDEASVELKAKISGFIVPAPEGGYIFHMSRWPRRAGLEVPSIEESRQILEKLHARALTVDSASSIHEESFGRPAIRFVFGLEEGYFEGRRKNLVASADAMPEKTVQALQRAIELEIGDLSALGIDMSGADSFDSLLALLESTSFAKLHSAEEAREVIGPRAKSFEEGLIYSFDGSRGYSYEEPCVVVTGPHTDDFVNSSVRFGHAARQARFSMEDLLERCGSNVELLDYSENAAARMR